MLQSVERPATDLPTFAELEHWDILCRWLDVQPVSRARLPILGVPKLGDAPAAMLRDLGTYWLVWHGEDFIWWLPPAWKKRLLELRQGVMRAECERILLSSLARSCRPAICRGSSRECCTAG